MDFPRTPAEAQGLLQVTTAEYFRKTTGKAPTFTSAVWWDASKPAYLPVYVPRQMTVKQLYCLNGTAVSGNCDIGLYGSEHTSPGVGYYRPSPGGKLVSSGSTVQAGSSQWQAFNVTDCPIGEGWYWLGYVLNNGTGQVATLDTAPDIYLPRIELADAFPLPAVANSTVTIAQTMPVLALGGIA